MLAAIRRLFTANTRLPDELQNQLEGEGLLCAVERVTVIRRFSGAVPGLHSGASISRTKGTVAFTSQRAVVTLATRADPFQRVVDCRWDAPVTGPMRVEISATGVQIDLDLERVAPNFQGHLSLHYKTALTGDVLGRVPRPSLAQNIGADDVSRLLGVRPRT